MKKANESIWIMSPREISFPLSRLFKTFLYLNNCMGPALCVCVCMEWILFIFIKWKWEIRRCFHLPFAQVQVSSPEMLVCCLYGYAVCRLHWQFLPEASQWMGAEIRQNLSHFPPQPLPPLVPRSFLAQQTRKLPPGQETSLQHPSEMQADGETDGNGATEQ